MLRLSLNGQWVMRRITNRVSDKEGQNTAECFSDGVSGRIPGSVYSFLLGAGLMEDPYYRDRELDALRLMEEDLAANGRRLYFQPDFYCGSLLGNSYR